MRNPFKRSPYADYDPFAEPGAAPQPNWFERLRIRYRNWKFERNLDRNDPNVNEFPMGETMDSDQYIRATGDLSHIV